MKPMTTTLQVKTCPQNVAIVGTGDYARALAKRCISHGMEVTLGSRYPEKRQSSAREEILQQVQVVQIADCVQSSDLVVLAIHPEHQQGLAGLAHILAGKVIIDVSNPLKGSKTSNAEVLASLFPGAAVVKTLNSVSAYALSDTSTGSSKVVSVCSDVPIARQIVMQFVNRLGFLAVDSGSLEGARSMEKTQQRLFPGWGVGTMVTIAILVIWTAYAGPRYLLIRLTYTQNEPLLPWYSMFGEIMAQVFGDVAITLLALTYIPGPIAALRQLCSGTKHKPFSKTLDRFLQMRKVVGLFALLMAIIHGTMYIFTMNIASVGSWYETRRVELTMEMLNSTDKVRIDLDSRLNWKGQLCALFGSLAMAGLGVIGISSLNSVAERMNWREWQCIQSNLGLVVLCLSILHVALHAGPNWANYKPNHWPMRKTTQTAFLSMFLPVLCLLMKAFVLLPCIYIPVQRIRRSWERGSKSITPGKKNQTNVSTDVPPYYDSQTMLTKFTDYSSNGHIEIINMEHGTNTTVTRM